MPLLAKYLTADRVVDLSSRDKAGAIRELAAAAARSTDGLDAAHIAERVFEREALITTRVGDAVALPHARLAMGPEAVLAVGRSVAGVDYDDDNPAPVRLLALLLVDERRPELALTLLSALGRRLRDERLRNRLIETADPARFAELLDAGVPREEAQSPGVAPELSALTLRHAVEAARESGAAAAIICVDAETEIDAVLDADWPVPVIIAGQDLKLPDDSERRTHQTVLLPAPGRNRTDSVRLGLLMCVAQRLVGRHDVVVALSGPPHSGWLDTLLLTRVGDELGALSDAWVSDIAVDIRPAVLERLVEIATSLGREGREGRSVGTIFIVGDSERVLAQSHQLIINPFRGYDENDLNILDPRLEETIKELAAVDGAFIVRGDGVLLSAGTYLRPVTQGEPLPSGLGTRHAVAAATSASTAALAIVVSESSGAVTVFHDGRALISLSRSAAG
ncbi:MAG: diadenylate cyclase [Verrucomicrobia bacterium]|nr:diadenylate cyclase [Verrucomicrobiota bacterium]